MSESDKPGDTPLIRALPGAGRHRGTQPPNLQQRARLIVGLAIVLLIIAFLPVASRRLADWLWYRDLGFERVFLTKVAAQWALGIVGGLAALAILIANVRLALRGAELDPLLADTRFTPEARARATVLTRLAALIATPGAIRPMGLVRSWSSFPDPARSGRARSQQRSGIAELREGR